MRGQRRARSGGGLLGVVLAIAGAGCSARAPGDAGDGAEPTATQASAILNGSVATDYPEAVLVDLYAGGQLIAACSGAVVSTYVVLTAGHCLTGVPGAVPNGWMVTAPYAGNTAIKAVGASTYDWSGGSATIVPTEHDVGVLFLASGITLPAYPAIEQTEQPDGTPVVSVGRMNNGALSKTDLYASQPVTVSDGSEISPEFPYDYAAQDVIEDGDSGGPTELPETTPHMIVAVNSGEGSGQEVLARTDPVYDWITMEIMQHASAPIAPMTGADGGGSPVMIGTDAGTRAAADAGPKTTVPPLPDVSPSSGGCAAAAGRGSDGWPMLLGVGLAIAATRRARRRRVVRS